MITAQAKAVKRPVVAILAAKDSGRRLRGGFKNFKDLIRVGKSMGATVYVTTVQDLKLSQEKITGHYYDKHLKAWSTKSFPGPDVVYNRIPYRKYEESSEVQKVIQLCLLDRSVHLFNPSFFNKWTLYEWLSNSKTTKSYIPETDKLTSMQVLNTYLSEFKSLYMKPIHGKAGKGIMRVSRISDDTGTKYRLIYHDKNMRVSDVYLSVYDAWKTIKRQMGGKDYIIQQAIDLSRSKGQPFDLRILVQRNRDNVWELTGMGARVAGKRSITTHVPRGGSIKPVGKLLKTAFGVDKALEIKQNATKLALVIAQQIEKSSGHTLGEMSMDVGVDTNGGLWFFEANSKPMKFDEPKIRKKSLRTWIQYCMFLSNHNSSK
ncbi:endospore coat-associated protein [Paenibacillus selenitireducens]|uniref:Endospore coat-associated protein n=1 Tax=Paenibacillus selenitireducens TaxID=1324314 RepID=A0A1T2XLV7_9BACL|nr:YheC/YheD family protein [Paenibacillus selenitireducens]OPA80860.1 endospore coat-associated protein [Paenibacillus selenitireducens]